MYLLLLRGRRQAVLLLLLCCCSFYWEYLLSICISATMMFQLSNVLLLISTCWLPWQHITPSCVVPDQTMGCSMQNPRQSRSHHSCVLVHVCGYAWFVCGWCWGCMGLQQP